MDIAEKMLRQLCEASRDVLSATEADDTDAIGSALAYRRRCIEALAPYAPSLTGREALARDALKLDAEIRSALDKKRLEAKEALSQSVRKASGLPRYLGSTYNLASGRLLDRSK